MTHERAGRKSVRRFVGLWGQATKSMVTQRPSGRFDPSPDVAELVGAWAEARCGRCKHPPYPRCSEEVNPRTCRHPSPSRPYREYPFGPLGWSGDPDGKDGRHLAFCGIKKEVLDGPEARKRGVAYHEFAHERQHLCWPELKRRYPLKALNVFALELEAERETRLVRGHDRRRDEVLGAVRAAVSTVLAAPLFAVPAVVGLVWLSGLGPPLVQTLNTNRKLILWVAGSFLVYKSLRAALEAFVRESRETTT